MILTDFRALERTWVIAEIGVNHEGDFDLACDLIDKAAAAGADAVKFQTFAVEHYISTVQPERRERAGRFQLSNDQFRRLAHRAAERNVVFFSTPLHQNDVDFLDEIAPLFKISSGDLTHLALISHTAAKDKPMILSTGLGTEDEIAAAIAAVRATNPRLLNAGQVMLMHCVACYPTAADGANLRNIAWLADTFGLPVGYSDHTLGIKAGELAVAAGAVALEKHFTYRKEDQTFHDHKLSADPTDLGSLVAAVREAEVYLGSHTRSRSEAEESMRLHMRRSLAAAEDIAAGVPVRIEQLTWLRPAWGLGPEALESVVGRCLTRPVPAGDLIRAEDVAAPATVPSALETA